MTNKKVRYIYPLTTAARPVIDLKGGNLGSSFLIIIIIAGVRKLNQIMKIKRLSEILVNKNIPIIKNDPYVIKYDLNCFPSSFLYSLLLFISISKIPAQK